MKIPNFNNYTVDHLFLLIGENPLPNYVAAKLLLAKGGIPHFIYTTDTDETAKRLATILQNEGFKPAKMRSLEDRESDAFRIENVVQQELDTITTGKIGINYTGGTKTMAVHAYRTLCYEKKNNSYQKRLNIQFSYLDPRHLEMCIEEGSDLIRLKIRPDTLEIKLPKLFQIHQLELDHDPVREPILPELAVALAQLYSDIEAKDNLTQWRNWFYEIFSRSARKEKSDETLGDWKNKTEILKLSFPIEILPDNIQKQFQDLKFLDGDGLLAIAEVQKQGYFSKPKNFGKWLEGIWLEHYVLRVVQEIASQISVKHYGLDFSIPLAGTEQGFQFDVAFTRGYQLFAISCSTTSDRQLCKSKLFEACLRAEQMGGSEAKVALVCCSDEPDTLQAELSTLVGNNKLRVFGRDDLVELPDRIIEWVKLVEKKQDE
ncbi:DUF1887 domain-containing protein [Pantanalinema rosaneae CENA516]|uniref:DUF1887 domain-containing protein n=1 Tax=Pantanalinema rosaneae TaxID=1620701 RepID=UPI003D6E9EC2